MLDKKENMNLETYGGYIAKVIFNNGQSIEINKNDIVIFVGPNNVGKSQALKDLYVFRIIVPLDDSYSFDYGIGNGKKQDIIVLTVQKMHWEIFYHKL